MTTSVSLSSVETGNTAPVVEQTVDPNRPEWLDPQFATVEDQNKAYKSLQAEYTKLKQGKGLEGAPDPVAEKKADDLTVPDKAAEEKAAADKKAAEDKKAADAAKTAGVDLTPYQSEFTSTGDVSVESRDKIAKGLEALLGPDARTIVDQYIDGRKTSSANDASLIKDAAGGAEAYTTMVNWAASSLDKDEIAHFNTQVNSGNRAAATFAVEALRSRFEQANGRPPRLFKGTFTPPGNVTAFASAAEMTAAMKDPKYKTDPAYRASVARRLAVSNI